MRRRLRVRAIPALLLDVVEEREDCRRVEVGEGQGRRRAAGELLREAEEQSEGVAVARDRLGAGRALRAQAPVEEVLEQGGERDLWGRHTAPSSSLWAKCSKRLEVMARSSGTAERYQYV